MGGKQWTTDEKKYFLCVILPNSNFNTPDASYNPRVGKGWIELASMMQRAMDRVGGSSRTYRANMLYEHYYQSARREWGMRCRAGTQDNYEEAVEEKWNEMEMTYRGIVPASRLPTAPPPHGHRHHPHHRMQYNPARTSGHGLKYDEDDDDDDDDENSLFVKDNTANQPPPNRGISPRTLEAAEALQSLSQKPRITAPPAARTARLSPDALRHIYSTLTPGHIRDTRRGPVSRAIRNNQHQLVPTSSPGRRRVPLPANSGYGPNFEFEQDPNSSMNDPGVTNRFRGLGPGRVVKKFDSRKAKK